MSRKIKFRAWDNGFKKMYYDGFALRANGKESDGNILFESSHFKTGQYAPLDMKIMQFTGLKDKNGVEIYEGDICKQVFSMKETVGDVRIESTRGTVLGGHTPIWPHHVEIIGNIYENPELLKQ